MMDASTDTSMVLTPAQRLLPWAIALLLMAGAWAAWGMWHEDNHSIGVALFQGELAEPMVSFWLTDYYTFQIPLVSWLAQAFPSVAVFGLWMLLHVVVWLATMLSLVFGRLRQGGALGTGAMVAATMLVLALTADALVHQANTRVSIFMAFTGLMAASDRIGQGQRPQVSSILLFLLAVLIRIHTSIIVLAFFLAWHVLTGRQVMATLKAHRWHLALGLAVLLIYQTKGWRTDNVGEIIEANYEYALLEQHRLHPLPPDATAKDSMRYATLQQFMISDSAEFTLDYLARTIDVSYHSGDRFSKRAFDNALNELKARMVENHVPLLMALALLLLAVPVLGVRHVAFGRAAAALAVWLAVLLGLLLVVADEMKPRFFEPFTAMVLLMCLLHILPPMLAKGPRWMPWLLVAALGLPLVLKVQQVSAIARAYSDHEREALEAQARIRTCSEGHRIIAFTEADLPLTHGLLHRNRVRPYDRLSYFDGGYLIYFDPIKQRFINIFGCSPLHYPCLIEMMRTQTDIVYYATPERLQMAADYFRVMYGVQLHFYEISEPACEFGLNGKVFEVKVIELGTP
jgi:hypothetical protein